MGFRFNQGDRPLPGYTIQRGVGRGGFGEVYYATSDGGKEVALKYLRENPQVELRGVQHCLNLKSPHLVAIHDVKQSPEGDYFVIMEFVSGPSLRDLLNNEAGGLGPQKAAYFLREIGKGLAYLHDRGIVHRDLKPGNIFYEDGYVKIGDYGLAKIMAASQHSGQTVSVGTVHYMAPEVGSGNYDRTIDIYALGVMLYEMLLGKVPFSGATMGEVLMKHLTAQPVVDELPAPFPNVIRKALAKDPKDRYQTVQEMISDLFDVADIERSVAAFEPASLTALAVHAGAQLQPATPFLGGGVAVLGNGSSNVGQYAAPPVINPAAEAPGRLSRFERLERLNDRVQGKLDRIAERVDEKVMRRTPGKVGPDGRKRDQVIVGVVISTGTKRAEVIAGVITIAALSSLAIGFVSDGRHGLAAALGSFMFMSAILAGVVLGAYLAYEKIRTTSEWTARLLVTGLATGWSATALAVGKSVYKGEVQDWFIAVGLIMLLSDWISRFYDGRRGIISAGRALKVGLFAFILAGICDCNVPLVGFSVLVASLLVQKLAGAWPLAAANTAGAAPSPAAPRPGHDQRIPIPPAVAVSRSVDSDGHHPVQVEHSTASAAAAAIKRSPGARTAWLVLSIPLLISAIIWYIAAGLLGDNDRKIGAFCLGGTMTSALGLFTLTRSLARVKRGVFRELIRPFIFFLGAGCAACCGIGAGMMAGHSNREMFPWVIGVVIFGISALSVWLIPVAPWQPAPDSPDAQVRRETAKARWLLGIGIALFCSLATVIPVLEQMPNRRDQNVVIPAVGAPILATAIALTIMGGKRLYWIRSKGQKAPPTLPLRRVFQVEVGRDVGAILERHLQSVGYALASKENQLWTFTRGRWHSQFWVDDIRKWGTTLNVAGYATDDGGTRLTCYLDLERNFGKPKRKQLAMLDAELDDLRDVLEAREVSSAV